MEGLGVDFRSIYERIREDLKKAGVDFECCGTPEGPRVRVVCVTPGLKESVEELSRAPRDQVVMVRVDEETSKSLDAWVATGAVKSRSEAAALFIREGLRVRAQELEQLRDALGEVEQARERLREKARQVFGAE